jgi:hypothetical protein
VTGAFNLPAGRSRTLVCAGSRAGKGWYCAAHGLIQRLRSAAPADRLVTEQLDGEVLLYVEATHKAFCLNPAAARVWESIDGTRDVSGIAQRTALEPELVNGTLREMGEAGLLDEVPDFAGVDLSRRRLVRAGLVAIPLILAITVPRAAEAASNCTPGLPPDRDAHRRCPAAPVPATYPPGRADETGGGAAGAGASPAPLRMPGGPTRLPSCRLLTSICQRGQSAWSKVVWVRSPGGGSATRNSHPLRRSLASRQHSGITR